MMISRLKQWWASRKLFVVIDPVDNSVVLSKRLFARMQADAPDSEAKARVFVFKVPASNCFGFAINPVFDKEETQWCDIQYNEKHKCIGFETLCPSVGLMIYDYRLPAEKKAKLCVSVHNIANSNLIYYQINRP